jgi:threonine/homoserine/homoserine lactone efflux protein
MLLTSGVNYGVKRTIPHALGIGSGFFVLLFCTGLGLIKLFDLYPVPYTVLKVLCVIYMFWLAWKILQSGRPQTGDEAAKPITFMEAALFQWVNPKAWAMAITAFSVYAPSLDFWIVILVSVVFVIVNVPSVGTWVILGVNFRRFLSTDQRLKIFNIIMALLLIASLWPILA